MMDKAQKDEIKKKAEKLAAYLGYNVNSINLDVINVQETYCQGYSHALEDTPQLFPMDKWIEFKQKLLNNLNYGSIERNDVILLIEELESFGKPAGDAK
jgi:hypothetical protein